MSNDNITNNFEELTFRSLLDKYDKILIPMIQRDYAQGRTDKKAQEVRINLLNDIFDEKKKSIHFDLIFGSCEKRNENDGEKQCFVPVDGQQRLTTLFLLYLYNAHKTEPQEEKIELSKFSYDTRRAAADFCKKVATEQWNVSNRNVSDTIKDSVWFMNYWENDPTVAGMLNMLDAIHKKANAEGTVFPNLDKVRFYFFDLETNGLNENLYLKMNSRGKPLTAFENLKASIEKMLPNNSEIDDASKCFPKNDDVPKSFKEKWKFYMDRDWTNAFWDKEHPENTDKNITAFIVRFLSGYYNAFSNSNEGNEVADKLKDINNKNGYADFIPFEPIRKSLELQHAFQRLAIAFTAIVNKEEIKPNWNETIKTTDFHEYKIIAVVFAYVLFDGNSQAMRVAWNLAENTVSGYDSFIAYCKRIGEIFGYHKGNADDIYQVLATKEFKNPSAQLTEEIAKAKQILNNDCDCVTNKRIGESWEDAINKAEKYAFFKGAIRFLFQDENGNVNWCDFDKKWENAQKYFDKNGVKETYRTNAYLLRYYISKFNEWWMFWNFPYDNEPTTWKSILTSNRFVANHSILIQRPEYSDLSKFKASLEKYDDAYKDWQNNVQNDLVNTTILVEASKWSSKLNWHYSTYCLYPYNAKADRKKYVIGNYRNHILSRLCNSKQIIVEGNRRFQSGESNDFFWGWDINFNYSENENSYDFQWNADEHIYLIENNERKKKVDGTDYCVSVKGIDNVNTFENKLNELIRELAEK